MLACRKELNDTTITIEEESPTVLIETAIRGKVINEEGSPLAGALVAVDNNMLTTDDQGRVSFCKNRS